MLTCEIRINGMMIAHIYVRNITGHVAEGKRSYEYEVYQPESRGIVAGHVTHKREDGATTLVAAILKDVAKAAK